MDELAAYLAEYRDNGPVLNVGLVAGENLRGLGAVQGKQPVAWFSLTKAQEAVRTKKDLSMQDVSGGRITVLGTPRTVGTRKLAAGDQFFFEPATKALLSFKTLVQLRSEQTPAKAAAPAKLEPATATKSVSAVQELLRQVGSPASAKLKDGKWGPTTKAEWERAARAIGSDASSSGKAGATSVTVSTATFNALEQRARAVALGMSPPLFGAASGKPAAAKPTAASKPAVKGKPVDPSRSGMTKASVGQLQDVLNKLGAKLTRDGTFGPSTVKAWQTAAARRKLDGAIDRAGPIEAWVMPATFTALTELTGDKAAAPKGVPVSVAPPVTAPSPGGAPAPSPSKLVPISQAQLQQVLKGFQKAPKSAAELQTTWNQLAKSMKLDGTSMTSKSGLEVVPKTRDALVKEGAMRIDARKLVAAAKSSVVVKALQEGLKFANQVDAYKGQFSGVSITGLWDLATANAFFVFLKIPPTHVPTWEKALPSLVAKDRKSLKVPVDFAKQINQAATNYQKNRAAVQKAETAQKAVESAPPAVDYLASRVAAADTITPVIALQQALSEVREQQKAGKVPGPLLPGIKLTGVWDSATDQGLYASFSDKMWGKPRITKSDWAKLLTRVLVKTAKSAGMNGLYGVFGDLAAAPTGANYIRLPAAVAKKVQDLAAAYVARSAKKGSMTESRDDVVIPQPAGGSRVAGGPVLITGRVPQPAPPSPPPLPVTGDQIQVPVIETPEGEQIDFAPGPAAPPLPPAPAPVYQPAAPAPVFVAQPAAPAPVFDQEPQASAPEPEPSPAPVEPEKKSSSGMIGLAILAGLGAAALLFQGEKEHRQDKQRRRADDRMR